MGKKNPSRKGDSTREFRLCTNPYPTKIDLGIRFSYTILHTIIHLYFYKIFILYVFHLLLFNYTFTYVCITLVYIFCSSTYILTLHYETNAFTNSFKCQYINITYIILFIHSYEIHSYNY